MARQTAILFTLWLAVALGQDANPSVPYYGYGSIVASPNPPVVGAPTTIEVTVDNQGSEDAYDVKVQLSFNTWGVVFDGWQPIGTQTVNIAAGDQVTLTFTHVFISRTHTCLEVKIVGWGDGGNSVTTDDRGQINLEVVHSGNNDLSYDVPIVNNGKEKLSLRVQAGCMIDGKLSRDCPDGVIVDHQVPDELVLESSDTFTAEVSAVGLSSDTPVDIVFEATDSASGEKNHVLLHVIPTTVADMLNGMTLCCLSSVKLRAYLGTVLLRALQAYEDNAWTEALRLLRIFIQKATAAECYVADPAGAACLEKAIARAVAVARMLAAAVGGDADAMAQTLLKTLNAPTLNVAAAAEGGVPFGSSSLSGGNTAGAAWCDTPNGGEGADVGEGIHCWKNINDGKYGNSFSWIPAENGQPNFVGVRFKEAASISEIVVSRDDTGEFADRGEFRQSVQVTRAPNPSFDTPDELWEEVVVISRSSVRKEAFPAVAAGVTGIRLVQDPDGFDALGCTDELEVMGAFGGGAEIKANTGRDLRSGDGLRVAGEYEAAVLQYQQAHWMACGVCAAHIGQAGHDDFEATCNTCRFLFTSVQYPYQLVTSVQGPYQLFTSVQHPYKLDAARRTSVQWPYQLAGVRRRRQSLSSSAVTSVQYPYQLDYFTSVQYPYQVSGTSVTSVQWPYRLEAVTSVQWPYQLDVASTFAIREGGRTVGAGQVTEIIE